MIECLEMRVHFSASSATSTLSSVSSQEGQVSSAISSWLSQENTSWQKIRPSLAHFKYTGAAKSSIASVAKDAAAEKLKLRQDLSKSFSKISVDSKLLQKANAGIGGNSATNAKANLLAATSTAATTIDGDISGEVSLVTADLNAVIAANPNRTTVDNALTTALRNFTASAQNVVTQVGVLTSDVNAIAA